MVELERDCALIAPRRGGEGALAAALESRLGLGLPAMGRFTEAGGILLARTAPHQLLAMRDGAGLFAALDTALHGAVSVFDLSDARVGAALAGAEAGALLPALIPIDLRALSPGGCAQTVMGQLTALILQRDEAPTYELYCAASYRGSFRRAIGLA